MWWPIILFHLVSTVILITSNKIAHLGASSSPLSVYPYNIYIWCILVIEISNPSRVLFILSLHSPHVWWYLFHVQTIMHSQHNTSNNNNNNKTYSVVLRHALYYMIDETYTKSDLIFPFLFLSRIQPQQQRCFHRHHSLLLITIKYPLSTSKNKNNLCIWIYVCLMIFISKGYKKAKRNLHGTK